jgi:sulfotransferase
LNNGVHFVSGLPRSGSTLLSAILRQNPRFHAGVISPVAPLFQAMTQKMSRGVETSVFVDEARRLQVLRGLFDSYYFQEHPTQVVFDTHRFWASKVAGLKALFPEARMICCVRHVPWILDSLERAQRRGALEPSRLYDFDPGGTIYSRFESIRSGVGLVGFAWNATREAFYGGHADRLMLLQYETLAGEPERALRAVYDFLGEPWFGHDFEDVALSAPELDDFLGSPGLHDVRPQVAVESRRTILPPDLWGRVENDSFWLDPKANTFGITVV